MQNESNQRDTSQQTFGIGIDFGTSKSAIAVARASSVDKVQILQIRKREEVDHPGADTAELMLFPSFVRLEMRDKERLLFNLLDRPGPPRDSEGSDEFITMNFKLLVGKDWSAKDDNALKRALSGFEATLLPRPEELAGCMIYRLRAEVRPRCRNENVPIYKCVVSIPPGWTYDQRRATIFAARMAGFGEIELIEEPVASLIGLKHGNGESFSEGLYLVVDFGAGTCDVALMKKEKSNHYFVVDSDSDNSLGGKDIDEGLLKWVIAKSPYELDDERSIILGDELESDDSFHYYNALWHIEKWKVENNEYFRNRGKKPGNLFIRGLQALSEKPIFISKEDFEQIVESYVAERLQGLFLRVLTNQKDKLRYVMGIVLTGGSSQLIGFRNLVGKFFAEISERDRESVENLIVEAEEPQWTVVRGAALVDHGLTVGNRIVTLPLRHNVKLEIRNNETEKELRLLRGCQEIRGRSASVDRSLPLQEEVVVKTLEDTPGVRVNVFIDTKPVDSLTITAVPGSQRLPAETRIKVKYQIRQDGTFQIERCLVGPKLDFKIRHDAFHHTDKGEGYTDELVDSRTKFSLDPEDGKPPQKETQDWGWFVEIFLCSIDWRTRLVNFAISFLIALAILKDSVHALIIALISAVVFPSNVDLLKLALKIPGDIRERLK